MNNGMTFTEGQLLKRRMQRKIVGTMDALGRIILPQELRSEKRAFRVIRKYSGFRKLIVVTHGVPMRQFVYIPEIPYCGILEMQFNENSVSSGYVVLEDQS